MGIAVGGPQRGTISEMNVVPLIDVLLVLLVILMIISHTQTGLKAVDTTAGGAGSSGESGTRSSSRSGAGRRIVETQSAAGEAGSSAQPVAANLSSAQNASLSFAVRVSSSSRLWPG